MSRLITHILLRAGQHVGMTTSDGVLIDERMVRAGRLDGTGRRPAGPAPVSDIDALAVLETARGGIVLRGMGYESNDASVLTNVSSDHLDLQGIHTLPELAEVEVDENLPRDEGVGLGRAQRRRIRWSHRSRGASVPTSPTSRSRPVRCPPSFAGTSAAVAEPTSFVTAI